MFTVYGPKFVCFWLSEGFKIYCSKLLNSFQWMKDLWLWKTYRKSTKSQLQDLLGVESLINKQSSHSSHRLFLLDWAFTGQDTSIGFSGSGHTGRISFTQFCVCFVSCWYTPVSLSKLCPCRLLPDFCKPIIKFSSCSASHKQSVRSHLGLYQMNAPPVPHAKHSITL